MILDELTMDAIVKYRDGKKFELGLVLNSVKRLTDEMGKEEEYERLELLYSALPKKDNK